jgi:hypothetical protein
MTSSTTWSIQDLIRKVDKDYDQKRLHPTGYEWAGGRKFEDGQGAYGTNTST